jgi:hypothetical protein
MALSRLQGVAMLFGFIYNAKPDSKTNRIHVVVTKFSP